MNNNILKTIILEQQPPKEVKFLAFAGLDDWHMAATQFLQKYGCEPDAIYKSKGVIYVGPVPEQKRMLFGAET